MEEVLGVVAAAVSSCIGGTSIVATRHVAGVIDPLAIGSFRFGLGFLLLLPLALIRRESWPRWSDWPAIAALGILFFAFYPIVFNASFIYTTAARGALTLSSMPLLSIIFGAVLGRERPTKRKTIGVLVAMMGVLLALLAGLGSVPDGAWRGDLLMITAAVCMTLYNIWSKPYIARSGPIPFTIVAMGVGGAILVAISIIRGSFAPVVHFDAAQWTSVLYLGVVGGAINFYLWSYALGRTTPTRVAVTVTLNPVTASIFASALLNEPLTWTLAAGIGLVAVGIWLVSTPGRQGAMVPSMRGGEQAT